MASRIEMTVRNAFWSYVSMILSLFISFISRTVFIYTLGDTYLGVNGLFSNVLGVLSFAELGIGTAIGFSLYKPVAENNIDKIRVYMYYYKWAYRFIALVVTIVGISLIPFLDVLVTDTGDIGNIRIYYSIYLFNTVSSYFVSYKFSLVNAEQKNYIYTNINLIISISTMIVQIVSLLIWKSFLIYLVISCIIGVAQKIIVSIYFNYMYPYLRGRCSERLSGEEKETLVKKVKALVLHKIGDVSVHQTDNIIVSAFVSTSMVGHISNYNILISTVSGCISILFNSVTGSMGNMVATENKQYQYKVFKRYRFIGFWFYGFTSIALGILMSPFVTLWVGETYVISPLVVFLLILDYYMIGHRVCLNNIKSAAGIFEQDRYVALIQAVVNLLASIALVKIIGLPGVYLGTIIQGTISTVVKPVVSYKPLFGISSKYYFIDSIKYGITVLVSALICFLIRNNILNQVSLLRFVIMLVIVVIVPNVIFYVCFRKNDEYKYFKNIAIEIIKKIKVGAK